MKHFIFYWRNGDLTKSEGATVDAAFSAAGYGAGAMRALDFYEESAEPTYKWDAEGHKWQLIAPYDWSKWQAEHKQGLPR
jgi:hypothetical protein